MQAMIAGITNGTLARRLFIGLTIKLPALKAPINDELH